MSTVAHLDAMLDGIADDLRRGIKAHRLAVEQRAGEHIGVVALEPARDIDEQREGGGVAFREAVSPKPSICSKQRFGELVGGSRCRSCRR